MFVSKRSQRFPKNGRRRNRSLTVAARTIRLLRTLPSRTLRIVAPLPGVFAVITTLALDAWIPIAGVVALVIVTHFLYAVTRYKRCPSNRILVVFGKVSGGRSAMCLQRGGALIWPVIQDYQYMSLEPIRFEIETDALTADNERIRIRGKVSIAIGQLRLTLGERPTPTMPTLPRKTVDTFRRDATAELNVLGLEIVSLDLEVVERKP